MFSRTAASTAATVSRLLHTTTMAGNTFKIGIVSDNICPWCFVGKRRLEKAIEKYTAEGGSAKFEIKWHPFFLDPTLPKEGVDKLERYKAKFGAERMAQMLPYMVDVGKKEGINFSYGGKIANTMDSHRLVEWASKQGKQGEIINALFAAYFEDEKDVGDHAVLAEAAETAGLSGDAAREYLASKEGEKEVAAEVMRFMTNYEVSGVPFYLVQLVGPAGSSAVTPEGAASAPAAEGEACGPDGCALPAAAGAEGAGEPTELTGTFGASGAQEVEYFTRLLAHMESEAAKGTPVKA